MAFKWYAVQTYTGQESRVVQYVQEFIDNGDLSGLVSGIMSPSQEVVQVKNGKKSVSTRKFFPSYVLAEMDLNKESMHFIQNVNGVSGFVGGQNPKPLKEVEVDRILGRESESGGVELTEAPFEVGDAVKVTSGPFNDFDGVIEELNAEKGKAKVMVTVFGRQTPVEVDFAHIDPIS
jgi:transcriptional antiterminator NusG